MTLCLTSRSPAPAPGSAPLGFGHIKCPPAALLAPFVDYYWVSRWDRRGIAPKAASALLDPCVHLQITDGVARVMGVMRRPLRMEIAAAGTVVGVKFHPAGFHPFVQQAVSRWTDRIVPADEVFAEDGMSMASWARELESSVIACDGDGAAHAAIIGARLDAFLGARVPARDAIAEAAGDLVALIASDSSLRRVSDLVAASRRSERTLQRLFARYVGVSPAWVIKRYRLQSAARRLTAHPPADVRAVAWDLGYADQAHFIRDFRATIGVTPGAYLLGRR